MKRYLVTAALPYANGPIHIGHLAGCYLPADIFVRFMRLKNYDVCFICGSDEHGVPITIKAEELKKTPQEVVDHYHKVMKDSFESFGIVFDNFSGTSRKIHHKNAQRFFLKLYNNGYLSKRKEKQYYCENCKRFLPDRYVEGICPHCGAEGARGDQCDACGKPIDNLSLIEPKCKICHSTPIVKETEHFYLDLDKFQDRLKDYIDSRTWWKDNVKEFSLGWIKDGLKPRAITRDLDWGVKVPIDGFEDKVLYVWFDAPIGYISSTMEYFKEKGKEEEWEKWWKDPDTRIVHFLGKDNIVFHSVIWPSILMGVEEGYNLPYDIPANEYLNIEGKKLSTSKNWAIWLDDYLKNFQPDILRYVLSSILPENKDTDFSWTEFQNRNNGELADIYGNFINRTVQFILKYNGGKIKLENDLKKDDQEFLQNIYDKVEKIGNYIQEYQIRKATYEFMDIARESNKYFALKEPWVLAKKDKNYLDTVLYVCMKAVVVLSCVGEPFIPFTSKKVRDFLKLDSFKWDDIKFLQPPKNISDKKLDILFTKIDDKIIQEEKNKLGGPIKILKESDENLKEKKTEFITINDFKKIQLVVARVLHAEKVEKSDKLLKLKIDLKDEQREIVAGVAMFYKPEDLVGKKIIVVKNLEPATIRGIKSYGMLLAASDPDKKRVRILFADDQAEEGDTVG